MKRPALTTGATSWAWFAATRKAPQSCTMPIWITWTSAIPRNGAAMIPTADKSMSLKWKTKLETEWRWLRSSTAAQHRTPKFAVLFSIFCYSLELERWAHAKRKFFDAVKLNPKDQTAIGIVAEMDQLFAIDAQPRTHKLT